MKRVIAVSLLATLVSAPATALWAEQGKIAEKTKGVPPGGKGKVTNKEITDKEIAQALIASPNVPQVSHSLVVSFLDDTLPHLLADDERLAQQLGLDDSVSNPVLIDRALPLMLIRREDVIKLMKGAKPLSLVNNPNNWRKDSAGRLVPTRLFFSLKRDSSLPEAGPHTWSSVTLEQSREGLWRIIQVGAPKLSRAMRQHEDRHGANQFLLWIPDLNRHYLGEVRAAVDGSDPKIILTTLFDDRFVRWTDKQGAEQMRKAGDTFDVTSKEFTFHLRRLYEELALPRKSYSQDGLVPQPQIQQQTMPDRGNRPQPPVQAQ